MERCSLQSSDQTVAYEESWDLKAPWPDYSLTLLPLQAVPSYWEGRRVSAEAH